MADQATLFIDCRLDLGEGPLWHPGRSELFFFDINVGQMLRANAAGEILSRTSFDEPVSAAAVVDDNTLLIASASALHAHDIGTGDVLPHLPFEADNPLTRANDCRVSPYGDWWVSTMGRKEEPGIGSLYRYRDGRLSLLRDKIDIPNAICFAPDKSRAYFADTPKKVIEQIALDPETGLPTGAWEPFVDLNGQPGFPDGAVTDSEGFVWNAEYGGGRVVRYAPDGSVDRVVELPVPNVTCPCFGGDDLRTLYITTASQHMSPEDLARSPLSGSVFQFRVDVPGEPETPVRL